MNSIDRRWYVLRASYGREEQAFNLISSQGFQAYVAHKNVREVVDGQEKFILKSLIPNVVFAYLSPTEADAVIREVSYLSYSNNPPLTILDGEMQNFILATATCNEHLLLLENGDYRIKEQGLYRITDGEFKGVCGLVVRARRQQRLMVPVSDFVKIATPYIPSGVLELV